MNKIKGHKKEAWENAIDSLARYKFMMFGYWSAIWVHLNQIDQDKEQNPFRPFVKLAREMQNKEQKIIDNQCRLDERRI